MPSLSLPALDEPKAALLWFYKVKKFTQKLNSGPCSQELEARFTQMMRGSLKIKADKKATLVHLTSDEIVLYVKSQYLDSGLAIDSCFKPLLTGLKPRSTGEGIKNSRLCLGQICLLKSMSYSHLLTQQVLERLLVTCLREKDVEQYFLELEAFLSPNLVSTPMNSPRGDENLGNVSLLNILNEGDKIVDDIVRRREFFVDFLSKKLKQL